MENDDKQDWPIHSYELAKILGVSEERIRGLKSKHKEELITGVHYTSGAHSPKWTKEGAIKLAEYLPKAKAGAFLQEMGVKARHRSKVESDCLEIIKGAIDGFTSYHEQYYVAPYKVDLYLKDLNIAIECDERGHKNGYYGLDEEMRQKTIENALGCQFIRFNPDDKNFNIGDVINKIFSLLLPKYCRPV